MIRRERPHRPVKRLTMTLTEQMARALVSAETDLGDERTTLRVLLKAGFDQTDIVIEHDAAVELARVIRAEEAVSNG